MTATRELAELKELYFADGPLVTVYVDASRDTESGAHEVELRWRSLREQLASEGADQDALGVLDAAVADDRTPGRHGLVAVAAPGRLLFTATLEEAPARDEAVLASLPHLVRYLAQQTTRPPHLVVVTDRTGADISVESGDGHTVSETVDGSVQYPLHKTGVDEWSELHFQHRVENAWEANGRDVADAVRRLAAQHRPEVVVVAGEERARAIVMDQLSGVTEAGRVVEVTAGGRADGASEQALADAVREEVLKSVWANRRGLLERLQQDLGRGEYAAAGVDDVIAALRQAQVDTLLIAADGGPDGVGWFGEDGTELGRSEQDVRDLGVEQPRSDQLDEVLVRAAAGTGASVVVTPDAHAALRDGVAALLRY